MSDNKNHGDPNKRLMHTRPMFGRRKIYTAEETVTVENIADILRDAFVTHEFNRSEIDYLYRYRKGDQPILYRVKEVRPEICNRIVENLADQIVNFKTGYVFGQPILYTCKTEESKQAVLTLNDFVNSEGKHEQDNELGEWMIICGLGYRITLPNDEESELEAEEEGAPFETTVSDPRNTFIIYRQRDDKPLLGVKYYTDFKTGTKHISAYTRDTYFLLSDDTVEEVRPHYMGAIPIVEYPLNNARLGAFETALPLLDAINTLDSNTLDGVEQNIQAFLKFINCNVDAEQMKKIRELGAILIKSIDGLNADVGSVTTNVDQSQTHILKKDLLDAVILICAMPNRNGGSSTSDTGAAVILRDGWSDAEAWARSVESQFKKAEKKTLALMKRICEFTGKLKFMVKNIEIVPTRRNYENIQTKSQVLISMLAQSRIHPRLAFEYCNMFPDPDSAYEESEKYYQSELEKWEPKEVVEDEAEGTVSGTNEIQN